MCVCVERRRGATGNRCVRPSYVDLRRAEAVQRAIPPCTIDGNRRIPIAFFKPMYLYPADHERS
jgi:hypothetical protein